MNALQEVICCLGQPVAGNPAQYLMEKAFAAHGLDWRYLTLEVAPDALTSALSGMRAMGFHGGNIASPHKVAVMPLLDSVSAAAQQVGAVNFIHTVDQKYVGENTEGKAAVTALKEQGDVAGKKVVLFGAGNFGRAIAIELAASGVREFVIVSRSIPGGEALVNRLSQDLTVPATLVHWKGNYELPEDAELVINATTIGQGDASAKFPLVAESLRPSFLVADAIYDPPLTGLLQAAQHAECKIVDGLSILIQQTLLDFTLWTGKEADPTMLREAAEEFLGV